MKKILSLLFILCGFVADAQIVGRVAQSGNANLQGRFAVTAPTLKLLDTNSTKALYPTGFTPDTGTLAQNGLTIYRWYGTHFKAYITALDSVNSSVDLTAPTLLTATVENASPSHVDVVFSEPMNSTWSAASAFTVSGHTVSSVTRSNSTTGFLTVTPDFAASETSTLAYTQPGSNKMQDLSGNLLANITSKSITDNVAGGGGGGFVTWRDKHKTIEANNGIDRNASGTGFDADAMVVETFATGDILDFQPEPIDGTTHIGFKNNSGAFAGVDAGLSFVISAGGTSATVTKDIAGSGGGSVTGVAGAFDPTTYFWELKNTATATEIWVKTPATSGAFVLTDSILHSASGVSGASTNAGVTVDGTNLGEGFKNVLKL